MVSDLCSDWNKIITVVAHVWIYVHRLFCIYKIEYIDSSSWVTLRFISGSGEVWGNYPRLTCRLRLLFTKYKYGHRIVMRKGGVFNAWVTFLSFSGSLKVHVVLKDHVFHLWGPWLCLHTAAVWIITAWHRANNSGLLQTSSANGNYLKIKS